jgi:hypothetical protein
MILDFSGTSVFRFCPIEAPGELLLKYFFPVVTIGIAHGNATASLRGRCGAKPVAEIIEDYSAEHQRAAGAASLVMTATGGAHVPHQVR